MLTAEHPATRLPALLFAVALSFAQPSQATEYSIDPSHTYASFEIDHLGFSTQRGQFNQSSGTVEFDPDAKTGRIDITIDTASLDTGFALRDEILRSDTWFNAKDFPKILFRSQSLVFTDNQLSAVEGTLKVPRSVSAFTSAKDFAICSFERVATCTLRISGSGIPRARSNKLIFSRAS